MGAEGAQVEDVEVRRVEAESKLKKGKAMVEQQKKELHKTECQVTALTRWVDYANEYHHLAIEALEASNKDKKELKPQIFDKKELRQLTEAQAKEIKSLKAKAKTVGKVAVQNYIDNFEKIELYDTFINQWSSWNAQLMLDNLRQVHLDLDILDFEKEFGGSTEGRPYFQATGEIQEEAPNVEANDAKSIGAIVPIDLRHRHYLIL